MKKTIALLLCLLLVQSPVIPVFGQSRTIAIRSAEDLIELSENCIFDRYSEGLTVELMNDIALDGDFASIPLFAGVFEGNGHRITGLCIDEPASTCGLFRQVLPGGIVRDLRLEGKVTPQGSAETAGGIAGLNHGLIAGCSFSGTVSGVRCVGGIAGRNLGRIENSSVFGEICGQHEAGGIAGENEGSISGCSNFAAVGTKDPGSVSLQKADLTLSVEELADITDIGGIAGLSSGSISGCVNSGAVGYPRVGYNVGGIAGRQLGIITDCRNEASVTGRRDIGGISGQLEPDTQWHVDHRVLESLKTRIHALEDKTNVLIDDAEKVQGDLRSDIDDIHKGLEKLTDSAHGLASSAEGWVNENLESVNEILRQIDEAADSAASVSDALDEFTETIPTIMKRLALAADHGADAAGDAFEALEDLNTALDDLERGRKALSDAKEKVRQAVEILRSVKSQEELSKAVSDAAAQLKLGLLDVQNARKACRAAVKALESAVHGLPAVTGDIEDTMTALKRAFQKMEEGGDLLSTAMDRADKLVQMLASNEMPVFSGIQQDSDLQQDLFDAIGTINDELQEFSGRITDNLLLEDIRAIAGEMNHLVTTVMDLFTSPRERVDLTEDISSASEKGRTQGVVSACVNTGAITSDNNAGGIVGSISIDLAFDRDDDLNLSGLLSGTAGYWIYACVSDCRSYGDVAAAEGAGGIAGRMDYGALRFCSTAGRIHAGEKYAGGIAGLSLGTLSGCMSRADLSAGSYCGGIAGLGKNMTDCLAMASFEDRCEYLGSVAGNAAGTVLNNYYARCAVGGVDGFSFAGQTEPVESQRLMELAGEGSVFETVTVTFLVDGEIYDRIDIPAGGFVEALPKVEPDGNKVWQWDDFDNSAVEKSLQVTGRYVVTRSTISTDEEVPLFLAEGSFSEEQTLSAQEFEYPDSLIAVRIQVLGAADGSLFTFRMRAPSGGKLHRLEQDGTLTELSYSRDGSYLCFEGTSGMDLVYLEGEQNHLPGGIAPVLAVGAAAAAAAILFYRRKRSKAHS